MKSAEKLKRIKLISEQIFISTVAASQWAPETVANISINMAKSFVNNFEEFESEFLKEHEVKDENTKDD